ncbi:MAG: hypothetical protein IT467_10845 [Dokdonella sp.]|nr:hypothetical protein [Dokdonella sp.]
MNTTLAGLAALLLAGNSLAQDISSARYPIPQGELIVTTSQPQAGHFGAPPPFAQLDAGHRGYLTPADANAYPPLANDYIFADSNRDGRLSPREYRRWCTER